MKKDTCPIYYMTKGYWRSNGRQLVGAVNADSPLDEAIEGIRSSKDTMMVHEKKYVLLGILR